MYATARERFALSLVLLVGIVFFSGPTTIHAADLSIVPASGSFAVGKPFTVKVSLDPSGKSVNASDGTIAFDASVLSVVTVSKDGSAFSLWTADPKFSNTDGTIIYSGGTPSGFSSASGILTITFKAKKTGSAKVSFSKGSILAADGKGTDVYGKGNEATFTITDAVADPPPAPDPSASDEQSGNPPPPAPTITSSTNPKPDVWYASSTAKFAWIDTVDITGARTILADKAEAIPTQILKGIATSTTITSIADGVWYFVLQLKNDGGWGASATQKIQIDTVAPSDFDIALLPPATSGGVTKFSFKTEDALSGIDHYALLFGTTSITSMRVADVVDGAYPVPPQGGGPTSVTIRAYDKAGNVREVTRQLTLPKVDKPVVASGDAVAAPPTSGWGLERILTILFALIIGVLASWNIYIRKGFLAEHSKILKQVAFVGDKNDRIFSAMREEFEQMINDMDEKPQLSPQERDFLERIKEVLDISEELVDSGIEELKKMVRG